ncbi:hypothetical protein HB848_12340 [Listeria rocourtiae]|uniref:hypothetical protein n=1 Tax=Listeria rocourtiae TaxID=647910 RepID=UPI001623639A|nr:hypothetical protein [Listeria rocourtiae]MBC1436127.1 hypothetical protein [Listeria rocourtiae]
MSKKMKIATFVCTSTLVLASLAPAVNGKIIDGGGCRNNSDYYNLEVTIADEDFVTFGEGINLTGAMQATSRANVPVDSGGSPYTLQSQFNGSNATTNKIKEFSTRLASSFGVMKLSKYAITVWNAAFSTIYAKPKTEYYTTRIYTKIKGGEKCV